MLFCTECGYIDPTVDVPQQLPDLTLMCGHCASDDPLVERPHISEGNENEVWLQTTSELWAKWKISEDGEAATLITSSLQPEGDPVLKMRLDSDFFNLKVENGEHPEWAAEVPKRLKSLSDPNYKAECIDRLEAAGMHEAVLEVKDGASVAVVQEFLTLMAAGGDPEVEAAKAIMEEFV